MTILKLKCNMSKYCLQMILQDFNKSVSSSFISNIDDLTVRR